jgi:hypothetical protein
VLVHAIACLLILRLRAFPNKPKYFSDAIAQWPNGLNPLRHILLSSLDGLTQPMAVFGQIEFAGAARNGAAVLNGIQKVAFLKGL